MIIFLWLILFAIFAGSYLAYFAYLKLHISRPWRLKVDAQFCPPITILVPAHNEERIIRTKLENLAEVSYPKEKMEVILIDDASTDQTLAKVYDFAKNHPELSMKILKQYPRKGKASALNKGLEASSNDIIVVSDADAFWPPDIFYKALPYLSDPTIGAITGQGIAENSVQSWVTRAENSYLGFMSLWRLGESKIHSTIRFEGCFYAFKKNAFEEFDCESGADDSGTALRIVQNKFRAILVPEVFVASEVPYRLRDRMRTKVRRATQLTGLWLQCFKLLLRGRLMLPKRIAVPEIFLSVLNPFIFIALALATFVLVAYYPIVLIPLILALCTVALVPKVRSYLVLGILDQFILSYSIFLNAIKLKFTAWD